MSKNSNMSNEIFGHCSKQYNCNKFALTKKQDFLLFFINNNIQTFNICFNDHCTLLFYKSGIESMSFNIDRYSKLTAMILQSVSGLLMKHLTPVTSQLAAAANLWRHHLCVVCSASPLIYLLLGKRWIMDCGFRVLCNKIGLLF